MSIFAIILIIVVIVFICFLYVFWKMRNEESYKKTKENERHFEWTKKDILRTIKIKDKFMLTKLLNTEV